MNSEELPGILQCWWKPPRATQSKDKCARGAKPVMENFAAEFTQGIVEQELEAIAAHLVSSTGEDITEETLTSLVLGKMIKDMQKDTPKLWKLLQHAAYTPDQQKQNLEKIQTK
jgi:hypothetical protein